MRVGCFKRTASKHVYYLGWNRSPAQVGCMRQVLRPGALGRPRGTEWRGRWESGSGWGTHVNPWLIHVSVWQKPLQYCKVISLQLIKINEKKKMFALTHEAWPGLAPTSPCSSLFFCELQSLWSFSSLRSPKPQSVCPCYPFCLKWFFSLPLQPPSSLPG